MDGIRGISNQLLWVKSGPIEQRIAAPIPLYCESLHRLSAQVSLRPIHSHMHTVSLRICGRMGACAVARTRPWPYTGRGGGQPAARGA